MAKETERGESQGESIETLKSDPANPRAISEEGFAGLGLSMQDYGDLSGIVLNTRTGELVCGHQRVKTLKAAGATRWFRAGDGGYVEHPRTKQRFQVRFVDWPLERQHMANIVANNPEIQGQFTGAALDQLAQLREEVGFEALGLEKLRKKLEKELTKTILENDNLEPASDESGKIGDVFAVIVECSSDEEQRELLERFMAEGLSCRALT